MQKSDLPFGSEFSPSQIELSVVLEMANRFGGNWKAFENAVHDKYFRSRRQTSEYNRRKLANNCKLGMQAYGILDDKANLTQFGEQLFAVRSEEKQLYGKLARHILLNLHGMAVVQCVKDIQASGEAVDLVKLRQWLEERGVHFPRGGRHPSSMKLWLEKAGVFRGSWTVVDEALNRVLGADLQQVEVLSELSPEQRTYVKALMNLGGSGPFRSNDIERLATATYGQKFNEKNLPKTVLYPLQDAGLVTLVRGTKEKGRGAKPFLVTPTAKLTKELIEPLLAQFEKQTFADLRPFLRKPLTKVLDELRSRDKHVRGLALEALALKLMRLIDLNYVATRLRATATGGAEVDLLFESDRLVFSRWQVQCKNTNRVALDDVAKEVGLTYTSKSNVIVIVSTGRIGADARRYSCLAEQGRPIQIVFIDGADLRHLVREPAFIVDLFHAKSPLLLTHRGSLSLLTRGNRYGRAA